MAFEPPILGPLQGVLCPVLARIRELARYDRVIDHYDTRRVSFLAVEPILCFRASRREAACWQAALRRLLSALNAALGLLGCCFQVAWGLF